MHGAVVRVSASVAAAVLALFAAGCGPRSFDVAGKVTYNGAPLNKEEGQVVFVSPSGTQVAAPIGADGTYRASKVPAGVNRVAVYYPNPKAKKSKTAGKLKPGEMPPPSPPPFITPAKYASADTSELSLSVEKNSDFNLDLVGPPIP